MAESFFKQYKNEGLFGPLTPRTADQLKAREKLLRKQNRTVNDLLYINSNNVWVKLSSGVDTFTVETANFGFPPTITKTGFSSNSAYDNILRNIPMKDGEFTGGIFNEQGGSDYILDENLGFRPKAGITNFTVTHQNLYGTIRSATVEFNIPSKTQFDELEKLYLRPGFSMLLEFGHSIYIENDDDLVKTGVNRTLPTREWFSNKPIYEINKAIISQRAISDYNYDAVVGMVKNFSWAFDDAAGYNCSLEIISYGDILEGLKVSTVGEYVNFLNNSGLNKEEVENTLQSLPCSLDAKIHENVVNPPELPDYVLEFRTTYSPNQQKEGVDSATNRYVPFYKFLEFANQVIAEDLKIKAFKFSTELGLSSFVTFPEHTSANPFEILLPKKTINSSTTYSIGREPEGEVNDILNIFLNVDWLRELIKKVISDLEPAGDSYFNLIYNIVLTINKRLGGINDLDITYDEDRLEWIIVDRKVLPEKNELPTLNLYGVGTTAYNINLTSKISSELSSMFAIAAGTGGGFTGNGDINLRQWNINLSERHRYDNSIENLTQKSKEKAEQIKDQYSKIIVKFNNNELSLLNQDQIDYYTKELKYSEIEHLTRQQLIAKNLPFTQENIDKEEGTNKNPIRSITNSLENFDAIHRQAMQLYFEKYFSAEKGSPGLIPFELSFDLKGISGIKIGQSFLIDETVLLPEDYKGRVGFVVTGITQKILNDNWVTSIKSQLTLLEENTKLEPLLEETDEVEPVVVDEEQTLIYKNPLSNLPLQLREDSQGSGRYNAPRKRGEDGSDSEIHAAWDVLASAGTPVYSPIDGKVEPIPVWTSPQNAPAPLTAIRVIGTGDYTGQQWRLGYTKILANFKKGDLVTKGQQVGNVIEMASYYGPGMKNHLHIDIKRSTDSEFKGKDPSTLTYT